jgi:hypothetical protein
MPNKFTKKLADKICDTIASGCPVKAAGELHGVKHSTIYYWRSRHPSFAEKLVIARAKAQQHLLGILKKAAVTDTKAAMFLLERCWPEEYGRAWRPYEDRGKGTEPYAPAYAKPPLSEEERREQIRTIFGVVDTVRTPTKKYEALLDYYAEPEPVECTVTRVPPAGRSV